MAKRLPMCKVVITSRAKQRWNDLGGKGELTVAGSRHEVEAAAQAVLWALEQEESCD